VIDVGAKGVPEIKQPHVRNMRSTIIDKGKAIPLQAWTGPEGCRSSSLADFKTTGTWGCYCCQPHAPVAFTPRKYSCYSFLLEAASTPRPEYGRKDYVNGKLQWHHRESNPRPSDL